MKPLGARCARSPAPREGSLPKMAGGHLSPDRARWTDWSGCCDGGTGNLPPLPPSTRPKRPRPEKRTVKEKPRPGPLGVVHLVPVRP